MSAPMSLRSALVALACVLLGTGLASLPAGAAPQVTSSALTWSAPHEVDPVRGGFTSVSCVSANWCRAAGAHGSIWGWDGHRWSLGRGFTGSQSVALSGMECLSTSFCAVGVSTRSDGLGGHIAMFDGHHWRQYSSVVFGPDNYGQHTDIDCTSTRFCMMVAEHYYRVWNGSTWTPKRVFATDAYAAGVTCWSPDACFAFGPQTYLSRWNGRGWLQPSRRIQADVLDCTSTAFCVGVHYQEDNLPIESEATVYRDGRWSAPRRITTSRVSAVSCASTAQCVALTDRGTSTTYRYGEGWTAPAYVAADAAFTDASCPSATFCVSTTLQGDVFHRGRSGWRGARPVDPLVGGPTAVSCAGSAFCVLVDSNGAYSIWDGTAWSPARRVLAMPASFVDIDCTSSSFCMAIYADHNTNQEAILVLRNGVWTPPARQVISGEEEFIGSVSCTSATACAVVWGDSEDVGSYVIPYLATWNGTTWTVSGPQSGSQDGQGLISVSCTGDAYCLALLGYYAVETRAGTRTTIAGFPEEAFAPYRLSCAAESDCMAVTPNYDLGGDLGPAYRWDGTAWTQAAGSVGVPDAGLSCTSATFCVAVARTVASSWDGTSWTEPATVFTPNPGIQRSFVDVSCVPGRCVAIDSYGVVVSAS